MEPFPPKRAIALYTGTLLICITCKLTLGPYTDSFLFVTISIGIFCGIVYCVASDRLANQQALNVDVHDQTSEEPGAFNPRNVQAADAQDWEVLLVGDYPVAAASAKPRTPYLDNLKSALTAIVVLHHVSCAWTGSGWLYGVGAYTGHNSAAMVKVFPLLNQAYFMSLFFFVSAYFSPPSLDKKGIRGFLRDKLFRLGGPFLVYSYTAGPLMSLFIHRAAVHQPFNYMPEPDQTWFLMWLLLFHVCYAFIGGEPVVRDRPKVRQLLATGWAVGMVQLVCIIALGGSLVSMPITFGSLPFDVLFYTAGVLARRNGWLESLLGCPAPTSEAGRMIRTCHCLTLIIGGGFVAATIGLYYGQWSLPPFDFRETATKEASAGGALLLGDLVWSNLVLGTFTMTCSCSALALFHKHANFSTPLSRWIARAAYTVYLLHGWVLTVVTWAVVKVYEHFGEHVEFDPSKTYSSSPLSHQWMLWVGWLLTSVLTLAIVWPLAAALRALPGLNHIL